MKWDLIWPKLVHKWSPKFPKAPQTIWALFQLEILLKISWPNLGFGCTSWGKLQIFASQKFWGSRTRVKGTSRGAASDPAHACCLGQHLDPCLGAPWGPFGWSPRSRTCTFWHFVHPSMHRNHWHSISLSKHSPKLHYKTLPHTSSTSTCFRTSWAFDFETLQKFTNWLLILKYTIFEYFINL